MSSDRETSALQLSMSSLGGAESLQEIWAMMESGLSARSATPRHPAHTDSMHVIHSFVDAAVEEPRPSECILKCNLQKNMHTANINK